MSTVAPPAKRAARYTTSMQFVVPEKVVTHFHLREGDKVGDFGAGGGFFEKALSRAVGSTGRVYAFEIQKQLVERISEITRIERLKNVEVLWCDIETKEGCKLRDGILDAGLLSNTLFQLDNKAAALDEIRRLLHSGGKLLVIDWSNSFGGMGPRQSDVVSQVNATELVGQHGFQFERTFPAGEYHYGLAFRAL